MAAAAVTALIVLASCGGGGARLDRPFHRLIDKEDRKPFIYIYELPDIFNTGAPRRPPATDWKRRVWHA